MPDNQQYASILVALLRRSGIKIATAESCTGGLLAGAITAIPGSSEVFDAGVVSYSNRIKQQVLGVSPTTLTNFGAVSSQTAREMASGVRTLAGADIGISITGIAGPAGGTPEKPVGTVYIAVSTSQKTKTYRFLFKGNRQTIRQKTVRAALKIAIGESCK